VGNDIQQMAGKHETDSFTSPEACSPGLVVPQGDHRTNARVHCSTEGRNVRCSLRRVKCPSLERHEPPRPGRPSVRAELRAALPYQVLDDGEHAEDERAAGAAPFYLPSENAMSLMF
jgi:hypothetical protein